jgi:hypothetical protein
MIDHEDTKVRILNEVTVTKLQTNSKEKNSLQITQIYKD